MAHRKYSSTGLVIRRRNFSEADRLITLYTRDHGKITLLAKGVRRPKSRKRGHLEMFSSISFLAAKTKSMDLLTEVETREVFDYGQDMRLISVAYFVVETVDKLTREGEANERLYFHLLENMRSLSSTSGLRQYRDNFTKEILEMLGYWPENTNMPDPDSVLESVAERKINSMRVGKIMLK